MDAARHRAEVAAPVFKRDRRTRALYAQLSVFGYFLYGFGPSVPLLGHDLGLGEAVAALHGTAFAVGAVALGSLAQAVGLHPAFLLVPALLAGAALILGLQGKHL